jgi:hypothetical protein
LSVGSDAVDIRIFVFASLVNSAVVRSDARSKRCPLGRRNVDVVFSNTGAAETASVWVSSDELTSLARGAVASISADARCVGG